jgi:UDP-N-acetylglucosamine--N-acetylmuramyl-(pentapeptide) pyrophosphoryl-undecaprenol N-acetylglucosamine transferase
MKIIVSAGGTGGHIYPALGIINKFIEHDSNTDIIYVGTTNRMEKDIIPKYNIKYVPIEIYGLSKNIILDIKNFFLIKKAEKELTKLMLDFKPDVVLGIGGYVTYPVIKVAKKLGIKIFIHEQNAIPGKVNKVTAKYADLIGVSFASSISYFQGKNVFYAGNPTGERALKQPKIEKKDLGLNPDKRLIVIVSGSLGSTSVNAKLQAYLKSIGSKAYQVLYITGKSYYDDFVKESYPSNVKVLPYLENLPGILKNTDILVTRAGASTIAEIIALNVPSIFIPSPYVANNHQYYNALDLVKMGCGELLEEKDLSVNKLNYLIDELIVNQEKYQTIKNNLKKIQTLNSSELIYQKIKELIDNDK